MNRFTLRPLLILAAGMALALSFVGRTDALPRECLLLDERAVSFEESVKRLLRNRSIEEGGQLVDHRLDVDLDARITRRDVVFLLGVLGRERPAILSVDPPAAPSGGKLTVDMINPERAERGRFLLLTQRGEIELKVIDRQGTRFVLAIPDDVKPGLIDRRKFAGLRQMDEQKPDETAAAIIWRGQRLASNYCPVRVFEPGEKDSDGDGLVDASDTCPDMFDPMNGDTDGDGIGDMCDNCVVDVNPNQRDSDRDGAGDMCEPTFDFALRGIDMGLVKEGVVANCAQLGGPGGLGLLVLGREINMEIRDRIAEAGLRIIRPVNNHSFVVAVKECGFPKIAETPWFQAFVPWTPEAATAPEILLVQEQGGAVDFEAEITFSEEMTLREAEEILRKFGAEILSPGIELLDPQKDRVRRINVWLVRMPDQPGMIRELLGTRGILDVSVNPKNNTGNDSAKDAINIDPVHTAGRTGTGQVAAEWDNGWAGGDNTAPPVAAAGSNHPGLINRVRVRDHGTDEGIAVPAGCTAGTNVTCDALCQIASHAMHVGGTIAGNGALIGGGTGPNGGMGPTANLMSYEWPGGTTETVCERTDAITNFNTVAHNHSWGFCPSCTELGRYHSRTATYDSEIALRPGAAEVFINQNYQNYRNSLWNSCTGTFDAACPVPPRYTPAACTAPPPGVVVPAGTVPTANVANRFFTLVSPGATAKSVISIGNVDMVNNRLSASSGIGPTRDGRLKPEVVAEGTNVDSTCDPGMTGCNAQGYRQSSGTSMAAPGVTGALTVLAEEAAASGRTYRSDMARALLAHTATDLGVTDAAGDMITVTGGNWANFTAVADGPDFLTGYGIVNAEDARDHVVSGNVAGMLKPTGCPTAVSYTNIPFTSPIEVGGPGPVAGCPAMIWDVVWYVDVPPGTTELKATLAWNDPAGLADADPALVNDIDLILRSPSNQHHYSWWMDSACPFRPAARVQTAAWDSATYGDSRNTLEQVHVVGGVETGTWKIIINTRGVAGLTGTQPFGLMVSMN